MSLGRRWGGVIAPSTNTTHPMISGGTIDASTLSVDDDTLQSEILLYPNPTSNLLKIRSTTSISKVQIYDLNGRIVKEVKSENTINEIDISQLSSGIYIVRLANQNNSMISSRKIIKK